MLRAFFYFTFIGIFLSGEKWWDKAAQTNIAKVMHLNVHEWEITRKTFAPDHVSCAVKQQIVM